jgi:hypothetical protein
VTELFNATVETAQKRGMLSGEHFSVDGTLIQAWASQKSVQSQDGSDDDRSPGNWHGQARSDEAHESKSDGDSRLYRKSNVAPALPSYLGHVLTDNRRSGGQCAGQSGEWPRRTRRCRRDAAGRCATRPTHHGRGR